MYKPSEAEKADPRLYADNVRALMSRELKAPMVNVGTREEFVLKRSGVVVRFCGLLHPAGDSYGLYFPLSVICQPIAQPRLFLLWGKCVNGQCIQCLVLLAEKQVDNSGCNVLMKTRSMDKPRHMATIGELVDARRRATAPLV